jgi:hypothetical protein
MVPCVSPGVLPVTVMVETYAGEGIAAAVERMTTAVLIRILTAHPQAERRSGRAPCGTRPAVS